MELLDEMDYDCKQGEVITALINLKQSDFVRRWPQDFDDDDVRLVVEVSHKDDKDKKDWVALRLTVVPSEGIEPKKRNGWKWVIIYNTGWANYFFIDRYEQLI